METACLGLDFLGKCSYNPAMPQSYFTIGHLISVIALLLTLSQLTKPIIRFRLQASGLKIIRFKWIAGIAIASVFIADTLPIIPGKALPIIGYPIFWELLSATLFVATGVYLISKISKPVVFSSKNAVQYMQTTISFIASAKDDSLAELADDIYPSVKTVVEEARKYNRWDAHFAKKEGKEYKVSELTKIAHTILDTWSDKLFCKAITSNCPATALEIIKCFADKPNNTVGYALYNELIHQAFKNKDSILHREEQYSGLGFLNSFTNQIFTDSNLIESEYRPFQAWKTYEENIEVWQIKKYCQCLEIAFGSHLKNKAYCVPALSVALNELCESIPIQQIVNLEHMPKHEFYGSNNFKILREISNCLRNIVRLVSEHEHITNNRNQTNDFFIYDVLAKNIYEFFGNLSRIKNDEFFVRSLAIEIWLDVFGLETTQTSQTQDEIGKRLLEHIQKQIDANLNPAQAYYPPITKLVLMIDGIGRRIADSDKRIYATFYKNFLEQLKKGFVPLYKTNSQFALGLLPDFIKYDDDNCKLVSTIHNECIELPLNAA